MAIQKVDAYFFYHKVGGNDALFEISDEDLTSDPSYFGYITSTGAWIIQKRDASAGTYRYAIGKSDYLTAWAGKALLTYSYFNEI